MLLKRFLSIIVLLVSIQTVIAQPKTTKQPLTALKTGDKFPDIALTHLLNYPKKTIRLSEFKGKWIILDFWNIYCAPCIAAFPKMEGFSKKYSDKLVVFAYTFNSKAAIDSLKMRSAIARSTHLPILYDDKTLVKLISDRSPHHVWIDPKGYVRYITSIYNATEKNVAAVVNGEKKEFADVQLANDLDPKTPFFLAEGARFADSLQQYSYLSGYIDGLNGGSHFSYDPSTRKQISYDRKNCPILDLIMDAFAKRVDLDVIFGPDYRRIILDVKDTSRYTFMLSHEEDKDGSKRMEWLSKNAYCYGLKMDVRNSGEIYDAMGQDLDRLFNLKTTIEKRTVKYWALVRTDQKDRVHASGEHSLYKSPIANDTMLVVRGWWMQGLARWILFDPSKNPFGPIVLDETGYKDRIDIDLNLKAMRDPATVNDALAPYGLGVVEKEKEMDFVVIKERNTK
jgi:thiol-disulfide isomerase/thioredoxin